MAVDLTGAVAIALGASGRLYGVDSAGTFRQAVYGAIATSYEVFGGGGISFQSTAAVGTYVAGAGHLYRMSDEVCGANSQGRLVLKSGNLFDVASGMSTPLAAPGRVPSTQGCERAVSGDWAITSSGGVNRLVNTVTGASLTVSGEAIVELASTKVLLDASENNQIVDTTTGTRSAGSGSVWATAGAASLSPNGAYLYSRNAWISPSAAIVSAATANDNAHAHGDWVFSWEGSGALIVNRNTPMTTTPLLATVAIDDASVRNGQALFCGLDQGVPAFGKVDLSSTPQVTRWTPPERISSVAHLLQ